MDIQDNLSVEGVLRTNKTVEGLNTTIWKDVGSMDKMQIKMLGDANLGTEVSLVTDYSQLVDIPIRIKKFEDIYNETGLTLQLYGLTPLVCKWVSSKGLTDKFPQLSIQRGDIITATCTGNSTVGYYFLIEGSCLNNANSKSMSEVVDTHINETMPHRFTKGTSVFQYGFKTNDAGDLIFVYEEVPN